MNSESTLFSGADARPGELELGRDCTGIFATPVAVHVWPDSDALNAELRALILAREAEDGGMAGSSVGGWQSRTDFFAWDAECVRVLGARAVSMVKAVSRATMSRKALERHLELRLGGWANVSRNGAYNAVHKHADHIWSGTYYVAMGEPSSQDRYNGRLELLDPRPAAGLLTIGGNPMRQRCLIDPQPGGMVVFPSWLSHQVHPFFGKGERISVAFNAVLREAADDGEGLARSA